MAAADLPLNIIETSNAVVQELLPDKSLERYKEAYTAFKEWQKVQETDLVNERVLLAYFYEVAKKLKSSSLWSLYSMLKKTIGCNENIDISRYNNLIAFLKKKHAGYTPKKSKVFTAEEVKWFLEEAPDSHFLAAKVIVVFGICGGSRGDEISNTKFNDVKDTGTEFIVTVPTTKTYTAKQYVIGNAFVGIVRKYIALRPKRASTDRFFMCYREGKCINQVIGKNTIAKTPKVIAEFLGLDDPAAYTGHGLRRTSTTILADSGASIETQKRHGVWKSASVAEGYIQESLGHKRQTETLISNAVNFTAEGTSSIAGDEKPDAPGHSQIALTQAISSTRHENKENNQTFSFSNCSNFTIHITK